MIVGEVFCEQLDMGDEVLSCSGGNGVFEVFSELLVVAELGECVFDVLLLGQDFEVLGGVGVFDDLQCLFFKFFQFFFEFWFGIVIIGEDMVQLRLGCVD